MCLDDVRSGNKAVLISGQGTLVAACERSWTKGQDFIKSERTPTKKGSALASQVFGVQLHSELGK